MEIHGNLWESMKMYGNIYGNMSEYLGNVWKTCMEVFGKSMEKDGTYLGNLWKNIETYL